MVASTWVTNAAHLGHRVAEDIKECVVPKDGKGGRVVKVYLVSKEEPVLRGKPVLKEIQALKDLVVHKVTMGGQVSLVLQARLGETGWMEHKGPGGAEVDQEGKVHLVRKAGQVRKGHKVRKETRAIGDHQVEEDQEAKWGPREIWDHLETEGRRDAVAGQTAVVSHVAQGGTI